MSILIKGMEMPKEGSWKTVRIYPDGTCAIPNWQGDCTFIRGAKAVPVPPHGDLIDKKTVTDNLCKILTNAKPPANYPNWNDAIIAVMTAPTIIPAEEGET